MPVAAIASLSHRGKESMASTVPFRSSFLVFRLNCLHHEARSRLDGGELEPTGSGEVGSGGMGSAAGCDLPVTIANKVRLEREALV
jgi:hypothetical protein